MAPKDPQELASALYEKCVSDFSSDHLFYQHDLMKLGVVSKSDLALLLNCAQILVDRDLFRVHEAREGRIAWKIIAQSDADKLQNLNPEERLIYNVVHSTGRSGVWTKTIKSRTNLHQTVVNRGLKSLEAKNYIKSVRNVKFPQRKMYMLAHLQPSEDVTGGAWFTDGVLDADFIRGLAGWVEHWVSARSWFDKTAAERQKAKRQKVRHDAAKAGDAQYIPYLATHKGYPTVTDITNAINKSGLTPVTMSEGSVGQLLEMLCYDGRLISLRDGAAYKSVKKPSQISLQKELGLGIGDGLDTSRQENLTQGGNGMTEAPCGRCPVFTLCREGGPVNAENCEYFDDWFNKSLAF